MNDKQNKIKLDLTYYYKGSSNCTLTLVERSNDDIDLITDYDELITSVQTGYELMRAIEDLINDKFA